MKDNQNEVRQEIYLAPETTGLEKAASPDSARELAGETPLSVVLEERPAAQERGIEICELRDQNRKVFRLNDGTEQAVFYPEAVHVFDEETQRFEEIDNTLTEEEDGRYIRNGKNGFMAKFSCEATTDELFSMEHGMHRVTIFSKKNKKRQQQGVIPKLHRKADHTLAATDSLVFEDVESGVDMEYSVTGSGVKENILIRQRADVYRFPFLVHCESVCVRYDEADQRVAFLSNETGEEVFFIPSPFMSDAAGNVSTDVTYEVKPAENGDIQLTVSADSEWINAAERAFPVTIDPQINLSASRAMSTYSWNNGWLYSSSAHNVGTTGSGSSCNANRMYIKLNMPTLPRNPRIKKAELKLFQATSNMESDEFLKIGLYQVTGSICTGNCTPYADTDLIDYAKMKAGQSEDGKEIFYTFDITSLLDAVNKNESSCPNLVLKMLDEGCRKRNSVMICGSGSSVYAPQLVVTYESSYGVNTSYRTHSHEIGRFGSGSIDLACGNLMFESEDFAWAGNRMPVTIKHLYNSALSSYRYTSNGSIRLNTADFGAMKLGYGWKLNIMQSMIPVTLSGDNATYYVYIDENGNETYFKEGSKRVRDNENNSTYNLYEDVDGSETYYDSYQRTLIRGTQIYLFDSTGRLIRITDEYGNHMDITYTAGRITSVTDGAGREFGLSYNSEGQLTAITAPDNNNVCYTYTGNLLSSVTYPGGIKAALTYSSGKPSAVTLQNADGESTYKVAYQFTGDRLHQVTEFGVSDGAFVTGASSTYSYSAASRKTTVQTTEPQDANEGANNVISTVYAFDDDGNIASEYLYSTDTGNVGADGEESGVNPHSGNGGAGVVSNINNLLANHNFETLANWACTDSNCSDACVSTFEYEQGTRYGKTMLRIQPHESNVSELGVYQVTNQLPAGNYTFSAYMWVYSTFSGTENPGAYLRVTTTSGQVLTESEHFASQSNGYVRLVAPFVLTTAQSVKVQILAAGQGILYADAAQLENNPFANAYNMLENGNFERSLSGWTRTTNVSISTSTRFNMSRALMISGDLDSNKYAVQRVTVKSHRPTRETFTLSGWAKGYGLPDHEREGLDNAIFRLRAVIWYQNSSDFEEHVADFSPCTEEWQFASIQFSKQKYREIENIFVFCDYGFNTGTAYFDDIQLTRDKLETGLYADAFTTQAEDDGNPLYNDAADITDEAPVFEEARDAYGNALTETTFTDGEFGTIYRSFGFTPEGTENAGNDLLRERDARGNQTLYTVDEDTSRNQEVVDRCGNKTAYEYDIAGRTTKVESYKKQENGAAFDKVAEVSYAYDDFNNMTGIVRGDGMKYALQYNAFHNLESIGVEGKTDKLVSYAYRNGNGRLKEITYANGDVMKATYNSIGQMIAEKWYNAADTLTAHYKYVYDGKGNLVRSIDILSQKEYTYTYEQGRVVRAAESDITVDTSGIVTAKTLVSSVFYSYDSDSRLTRKRIVYSNNGLENSVYYENPENESTIVKFTAGGKNITSHSKTDNFGRKVFDELQLGTGFVSRQFSYHAGEVTEEHSENEKLKSSATTRLLSQIVLSGGRSISYEYDAEERITRVTDSVDGVTEYTYDAQGQLLSETNDGVAVNTMTYDSYGNILTKNGKAYTYGDSTWKDLLMSYDGQSIAYDAQGNPTSYLGHTLTWEKGRQLKSFDGNTYTYNANGIRTSKTVNGVKHTYTLEGIKILQETWGSNTLVPLYDNEDSVCGIIYNGTPYYFFKNQQGDIIAITDQNGDVIAKYSYDAWGLCTITQDSSVVGIASINPYRYRGYYYDHEIGMYYLQSRYYNPVVGRFVNIDEPIFIASKNLFCYCINDPISQIDFWGNCSENIMSSNRLPAYLFDPVLLNAQNVSRLTRVKALHSAKKCLEIIYRYESDIIATANKFHLPSDMIRAVLYRELLCVGYEDLYADLLVMEYYLFKGMYSSRKDSSTGLAQIFASTAIKAEKIYYNANTTTDTWTMWLNLQIPSKNIYYCGLVLAAEAKNLGYHNIQPNEYEKIKNVFTRYNGAESYGDAVLSNYKQFRKNSGKYRILQAV